jgi:hypothetical protein
LSAKGPPPLSLRRARPTEIGLTQSAPTPRNINPYHPISQVTDRLANRTQTSDARDSPRSVKPAPGTHEGSFMNYPG